MEVKEREEKEKVRISHEGKSEGMEMRMKGGRHEDSVSK